MPHNVLIGRGGRDFGNQGNDAASQFIHLKLDTAESQKGRMVRQDAEHRKYWFKTGRNDLTASKACLEKYHALVVEDKVGVFYVVKCMDIIQHPRSKASRSSGHGEDNPHIQIPMRCIREIGTLVDPAQFTGLPLMARRTCRAGNCSSSYWEHKIPRRRSSTSSDTEPVEGSQQALFSG